jgi:hypothetical protein
MAATDKGALSDGRGKKKKKCLCADINGDEVYSSCVYVAQQQWPCVCVTRGAMVGADAIMRRASSFSISWSGASVASTYHIITCSCRAADWSTAKPLPCQSRAHLPSVTFHHHHRSSFPPPCAGPAPFSNLFSPPPPPFPPSFLLRQTLPPIPKVARSWSRGRLQLSSLGCLSSRVSSARRSIPLPFFGFLLFFVFTPARILGRSFPFNFRHLRSHLPFTIPPDLSILWFSCFVACDDRFIEIEFASEKDTTNSPPPAKILRLQDAAGECQ